MSLCPGPEHSDACENFSCRHNGCQGRLPELSPRSQLYVNGGARQRAAEKKPPAPKGSRSKLYAKAPIVAILMMLCAVGARADDGVRVLPPPEAPGLIASVDEAEVCGVVDGMTYSQRHRQTTPEMKREVRERDGMASCGEIDHRLPLALGGADDVRNLWCQPPPPEVWNFKLKDRMEAFIWHATCRQHTMTLAAAQAIFLEPDWRGPFCELIGGAPCPP